MDWRRIFRQGTDVVFVEYPTDARPVEEHPRRLAHEEIARRRRRRRRGVAAAVGTVVAAGSVAAFFADGGWLDYRRLQREAAWSRAELERQAAVVQALERYLERVRTDPSLRERVARERLGLVRPGEIDFLLPRAPEDEPPGPDGESER